MRDVCMYDGYDSCATAFYSSVERRARKPHKCDECGRVIAPGENYQHVSAKWEGDLSVVKTCAHCVVVQGWLKKECGGFVHHAVIDDAREHIEEYGIRTYGFGLARLVVMADNNWKRRGQLVPLPAVPRTTHDEVKP